MTARKEIAVYDGETCVFTGDAEDVSERYGLQPRNLRMIISRGARFVREGVRLKPVYTGQLTGGVHGHRQGRPPGTAGRQKKPETKKKRNSLSEVVAAARAAGMGYGEYVARMEREKGNRPRELQPKNAKSTPVPTPTSRTAPGTTGWKSTQ